MPRPDAQKTNRVSFSMPLRRYSDRQRLSSLSELNVTPLIDLAFVLLIIFMIAAPLLRQGMELTVPATKSAQDSAPSDGVLTLAIDRNQQLFLNGNPVSLHGVPDALRPLREARPDIAVVLEAHRDLPVQSFVEVMEAVKTAGVTRFSIITRQEAP